MSHNFFLDLHEFIDHQMARADHLNSNSITAAEDLSWAKGHHEALVDLRCFINNHFYEKLPQRLQKKLASVHMATALNCRPPAE